MQQRREKYVYLANVNVSERCLIRVWNLSSFARAQARSLASSTHIVNTHQQTVLSACEKTVIKLFQPHYQVCHPPQNIIYGFLRPLPRNISPISSGFFFPVQYKDLKKSFQKQKDRRAFQQKQVSLKFHRKILWKKKE